MVLLIDANIILDVLADRKDFVEASSKIWKICETKIAQGYISSLTFANIVYVLRKELEPEQVESILQKLCLIFDIANLEKNDLLYAAKMRWNDYEDAIQVAIAKKLKADYIITRNTKDFLKSDIKALTPEEYLLKI